MGLETGNYVYDLVQANPPAGDQRKEGDDHLRLIKKVLQQTFPHVTGPTLPTSTGSANAQAVVHLFGPAAYQPGQIVAFIAGFTNTGPMTLAVNGLGAKNFYIAGAPVGAGNVQAGGLYLAMYDGVQFQLAGAFGLGGYLPLAGGTLTGALTIAPASGGANLFLNTTAVGNRNLIGQTAGSTRWAITPGNATAESGSNAGSDFTVARYSDAGGLIDAPLSINRASGEATFTGKLTVSPTIGGISIDQPAPGHFIQGRTGGINRWVMYLGSPVAESGGNAGSDFLLQRCNDAGALIDTPLSITRASGAATFGANLNVIPASGGANLVMSTATANGRTIWGQTAGSTRWQLVVGNGTAESGSNNGSDFNITGFTDAAALINTPISIKRSTGVVTFAVAIVNGPSDRSLKENIEPLEGALDKVQKLRGVSFNFIKDKGKRQIGLIAQDVAPIVPEVIQDFIQPDEEPKLAIDYTRLVPLLIEAIKELTARVAGLEKKLEAVHA